MRNFKIYSGVETKRNEEPHGMLGIERRRNEEPHGMLGIETSCFYQSKFFPFAIAPEGGTKSSRRNVEGLIT
jgi:hypothetical protein